MISLPMGLGPTIVLPTRDENRTNSKVAKRHMLQLLCRQEAPRPPRLEMDSHLPFPDPHRPA
jgi:hypothetical protein